MARSGTPSVSPDDRLLIEGREAAAFAELQASSLRVEQAAERLHVNASRIRQRLAEGSLYGFKDAHAWLVPTFQFQGEGLVAGLDRVLKRLPRDVAALAVVSVLFMVLGYLILWRIYHRAGGHPGHWNQFRHFGPVASMRFDHHENLPHAQDRGILYAALRLPTCFAEVFQETRTIERSRKAPWVCAVPLRRALDLLDLSGAWPTRAGASMAINSGRRDRSRSWSRAIYEAYPAIHGLLYPSSMDGGHLAVTLYERAGEALPPHPVFHRSLEDPSLNDAVIGAATLFGYGAGS